MSNTVDWSKAPEWAEFHARGFRKAVAGYENPFVWTSAYWCDGGYTIDECMTFSDYQPRPTPQEKPMKYEYGVEYPTNGVKPDLPDDVLVEVKDRTGLWDGSVLRVKDWAWGNAIGFQIVDDRYNTAAAPDKPKTAAEYLSACAQVQLERGKQYDASGTGERSFDAAVEAFNCITGKNLRGSDVCLILTMVKLVRQYSDPTRLHADSVLDAVSYGSLWAEELTKELK